MNMFANNCANLNHRKGYGVALSFASTARERFHRRQQLIERRILISNYSVAIALIGLLLAVIDVELRADDNIVIKLRYLSTANNHQHQHNQHNQHNIYNIKTLSNALRLIVVLFTILLDILIIIHHIIESKILATDTGQEITLFSRISCFKLIAEIVICSCCPFPGNYTFCWPTFTDNLIGSPETIIKGYENTMRIPGHILLTVPMFCRLYLVSRFMVLHADIHQDPSTRAIASFNQVLVDFPFVLKSLLSKRPLSILTIGTLSFWAVMTWIMTQCERYGTMDHSGISVHNLFDYAWFEVVTFFAIGFGDIQIVTYCGRTVAIFTGIAGIIISSLITVIISRRILLSLAEQHVNQVIAESQLTRRYKNEAARVLQWTWRVVCLQRQYEMLSYNTRAKHTLFQLRMAQRQLLISILSLGPALMKVFIKFNASQTQNNRKKAKSIFKNFSNGCVLLLQAFAETEDRLRSIRRRQQQLSVHVGRLISVVEQLSDNAAQQIELYQKDVAIEQKSLSFCQKVIVAQC